MSLGTYLQQAIRTMSGFVSRFNRTHFEKQSAGKPVAPKPSRHNAPQPLSQRAKVMHLSGTNGTHKAPQHTAVNTQRLHAHHNGVSTSPHTGASVLGVDLTAGADVLTSLQARYQGMSIFGVTGSGKTTFQANLIYQNILQCHGLCLIEPHGDLVRAVISRMPEHRLKDVILLDITDADAVVGLNPFECPAPRTIKDIAATSAFLSHVFEKVWGAGTETPRLMMVLRALTRILIENSPEATFCEIPLLLSHDAVRAKMVANLTNSSVASFWEGYNRRSQRDRDELTASTLNKVASFLDQDLIRNIVGQSKTTLNFRTIMDEGKILLLSLSPQYEEASRLLGSVIIGRLLMAAFSRADTPEDKRRPFFLYADEYQRYATTDFATLLAEARKFRLATTIATQSLAFLDEVNQAAALQAGTLVVLRVSGDDSKFLAPSYDATPSREQIGLEPQRSPVADVIHHLVQRGHTDQRVTAFAQHYLCNLDKYATTSMQERHAASYECWYGTLILDDAQVHRGRQSLNDCLFRCMSTQKADITILPLAIYVLATAQGDKIEYVFSPYLRTYTDDICAPYYLKDFRDSMAQFGRLSFLTDGADPFVQQQRKKYRWVAEAVVTMLTELRYCMRVLAAHPVLVDTGQYIPQYRQRTYADQENLIANELSQLANFHAKVRLLTGEHTIRTHPAPPLLSEIEVQKRIAAIKQRMLFAGICKPYREVDQEIRERQARLLERAKSDAPPPPSHTNGRRVRQKPPPPHT